MPWTRTMWGGFCGGSLDMRWMDDRWGGRNERAAPALFTSRKAARVQYEDVRKVDLTELLNTGPRRRKRKNNS